LKEKLKVIKVFLKDWHQQHSQNMDGKIMEVKNQMSFLDSKGEETDLMEDEMVELRELSVNLHYMARGSL